MENDEQGGFEYRRHHKRGRRKKYQKQYQDHQRAQLIGQMSRRLQNEGPTSSASVEDIPLPSDMDSMPCGPATVLTTKDYEMNYMEDPQVIATHSGEIQRSNRVVRWAEDVEKYLFSRAGTSHADVLNDFRERVLKPLRETRRRQTDVPRINHQRLVWNPVKSDVAASGDKKEKEKEEEHEEIESLEEFSSSESNSEGDGVPAVSGSKAERQRQLAARQVRKERKEAEKAQQVNRMQLEIQRKRRHPNALDADTNYNEKGLGNDGPICRCPPETLDRGLKHGFYPGEDKLVKCTRQDAQHLFHYTLKVTPAPNENQAYKTAMMINGKEFLFEGFSLLTHSPLPPAMTQRPICKNPLECEYELIEEAIPDNCCYPEDTTHLYEYIFHDVFEMLEFDLYPKRLPEVFESCPIIHIMPRFAFESNGVVNLWSTKSVLAYFLLKSEFDIFSQRDIQEFLTHSDDYFSRQVQKMKQTILINPIFKPSAIRADWFEKEATEAVCWVNNSNRHHSYAPKVHSRITYLERKLKKFESGASGTKHLQYDSAKKELDSLRSKVKSSRSHQIRKSVEGFKDTGLKPDVCAHIVMTILACHHIRYNFGITEIEEKIDYRFGDRRVFELAMIHSSMKSTYGTPADHVKTLLTNCGYRRKYGAEDRRERKKGIVDMFDIVSGEASIEPILHNERLEYLGDAVVELIVSHHLFFMLPHHLEGGLATYRTALVQNRNLAVLAINCRIDELHLFAHGAELCTEPEWRHGLANAFESLLGAVYLDGGIDECDRIYSEAMYGAEPELKTIWDHVNEHELKREDPLGDRELATATPNLQKFFELEKKCWSAVQQHSIHFINSEKWNDAKSHLQQWCLMLRDPSNPIPEVPEYKVLSVEGPTNTRLYNVGVYFRGKRLASATSNNVHRAHLEVAELALKKLGSARHRINVEKKTRSGDE
uniref:Uncharacterized protein n=1 Tax=Caenorhabditis japonica TaxID=281687 RepID=A0A8R1HN39_CAEJA